MLELESDCLLKYNVGGVFSSQFILWAICVVFVWKLLNLLAGTILLGQLADRGVNGVMIFFLLILSLSGGVCRSEENILFFVTGHSDGNLYVACE